MADIVSDLGVNLLEEEIDEVIFQTNQFLTDATFTGSQGPFWWILQMCMALAALFSIIVAAGMAYKMMVKHELLVVSPGGHRHHQQRQLVVRAGFPGVHTERHRLLHPRPL